MQAQTQGPPGGRTGNRVWVGLACLLVLSMSAIVSVAAAQEPSAADRAAAGTAYDRGSSAYLSHDYARAAQWFETAYRLAPNPQALVGAMRAHERAGDLLRAGTLALRAMANHADDEGAARQAGTILAQATPIYLRVDVTCSADCTVELDGTVQSHTSFFVTPSADHRVVATFETGTAEASVAGAAGETRAVSLEAPPAPIAVVVPDDGGGGTEGPDDSGPAIPVNQGGISPAFLITGAVLTAAAGGVLIWSGIDALDGVPAYEMDPTAARLADGQMRETRTNVLIGVTGGLALTTLIFAIVTDWDGDPPPAPEADAPAEPMPAAPVVSIAPMFDESGAVAGALANVGGNF